MSHLCVQLPATPQLTRRRGPVRVTTTTRTAALALAAPLDCAPGSRVWFARLAYPPGAFHDVAREADAEVGRLLLRLRGAGRHGGRGVEAPEGPPRRLHRRAREGAGDQGRRAPRRRHHPPGVRPPAYPVHHAVRPRRDPPAALADRRRARSRGRRRGAPRPVRHRPGAPRRARSRLGARRPGREDARGGGRPPGHEEEPARDPRGVQGDQRPREPGGHAPPPHDGEALQARERSRSRS